jgi:hypothetical protein
MIPVIVIERPCIRLLTPREEDHDRFIALLNRDHRRHPYTISLEVWSADMLLTE